MTDTAKLNKQLNKFETYVDLAYDNIEMGEDEKALKNLRQCNNVIDNMRRTLNDSSSGGGSGSGELSWSKSTNVYKPVSEGTNNGQVPPHNPVILIQSGIRKGELSLVNGKNRVKSVYAGNHNDNREHYRFHESWKDIEQILGSRSATVELFSEGKKYTLEINDLSKRHG